MAGFTINTVVQSGNLTRDPELRSLPSGTSVCDLGLAVNDRYKDSMGEWADRANFFDWAVFGGLGEWIAKNCSKGDAITLEGRARWSTWENDQGDKRSKVSFIANSVIPRNSGGGGQSSRDRRMEEQNQALDNGDGFTPRSDIPEAKPEEFTHATSGQGSDDDDIPF